LIPVKFENKKLICGNIKLPGFKKLPEDTELVLGIRPDFIKPDTKGQLEIQVDLVEQHGADNLVYGLLKDASNDTEICFKTSQNTLPAIDKKLKLKFEQKRAMVFNKNTGERLI
jgi:sn-glycerol 3-phosphate transport system ATP-binding protein